MKKLYLLCLIPCLIASALALGGCLFTAPPEDAGAEISSDPCDFESASLYGTWRKIGFHNYAWGEKFVLIAPEDQNEQISFDADGYFKSYLNGEMLQDDPFRVVTNENPALRMADCIIKIGETDNTTSWTFSFSADTLTLAVLAVDAGSTVYVRDF